MLAQTPPRSLAKPAVPITSVIKPQLLNGSQSTTQQNDGLLPFAVGAAAGIGIRGAASRKRAATTRRVTFFPDDCPRNEETWRQLKNYVAHHSDNASEACMFIKNLLNAESTERSGIGPMNFGEASGNLIVQELLHQTLWPVNVNEAGRFAESQLDFMKRVIALINETFGTNFPEDCVIQCEKDPSKFRLVIDKIPNVFEVLKKDLVTVIKHKETGVTLTMIRHFPTHFPDRMPSNAYRIKHDPKAIETHCKQIMQNLTELYKNNTFSKEAENNHLFVSNRSMIGSLTMIVNKDGKETEIFELSGKKPDLATIFSSIF